MSNVIEIIRHAPRSGPSDEYETPWRDYYRSMRSMMDRDTAMRLADQHVTYLRKRDAEIHAGVTAAMGET